MNRADDNASGKICNECQQDISEALAAGDSICPACGHRLDQDKSESAMEKERVSRKTAWIYFWALFIATPVTTWLTVLANVASILPFLVLFVGTLGAGFALAKLMMKEGRNFVVMGIVLSIAVFLTYLGIAFVGCLVVVGAMGGMNLK